MKLMALSGIIALASAGLAVASVEAAAPVDTVKPASASPAPADLVSTVAPEAVIVEKKADLPADVTLATVTCTADSDQTACAGAAAKN